MHVLNIIYVVAAVLFLFGAAVFVHEYGHFWMARRRGLKVEAFAIGFGPKLFSWKRDGIEYSWRLIPAGGYVALPQMVTSSAIEGKMEAAEKLPPISPLSKILVAFAGPFMNVVFAFVIATYIYFAGLPVPVNPPIIGYVEKDSPEATLGIQEGDVVVQVGDKVIKSWQDVLETTALARTNVLPVVIEHAGVRHTYDLTTIVSPGMGLKVLNLDSRDHPVMEEVKEGGAAAAAGLRAEDEVTSFDSVPIAGRDQFITMIQARTNQATEIVVKRDGKRLALTVTPRPNPVGGKGFINATIGSTGTLVYQIQRPGPTPWAQVRDVFQKTLGTFSALLHSKQTGVGPSQLSGPVGIFAMLASQVNAEYRLALSFLVLLNINLAFINLLPLPVLDGGHITMAIIEKIRRRPLNAKIVEYSTAVFAVLLISFMLYVTVFGDLKRFGLYRAMFKNDVQIQQSGQSEEAAPVKSK